MGLVACNECSRTLLCSYHVAVAHMDETADLWSVYFLPPPFHNRFDVSIVPFVWQDLQRQRTCNKVLRCSPRQSPEGDPFYMQVCMFPIECSQLNWIVRDRWRASIMLVWLAGLNAQNQFPIY